MSEVEESLYGVKLEQWNAAFRPGMSEFASSVFVFSREEHGLLRIAFGNGGPYRADGTRTPVYTHAVTVTTDFAIELARLLLKHCAEPEASKSTTSAELR